jgi:hypothetical protein
MPVAGTKMLAWLSASDGRPRAKGAASFIASLFGGGVIRVPVRVRIQKPRIQNRAGADRS